MAFYIQANSPFILFSWCNLQNFVLLIERVMNPQISVPFTILVLALELFSFLIHSFIGSFIPQKHVDTCTVSSGLELAHTGWQVLNVHIFSYLCNQWCHGGSLSLAMVGIYIPKNQQLLHIRVFVFLQRARTLAHHYL